MLKWPRHLFSTQIRLLSGMLVRCVDGTRCSPFASALFCLGRPPAT